MIVKNYYNIKKGQRTDLNPELKKKKEQRDKALSYMSSDTIDKLKSIDKMATELYGKNSKEYQKIFQKLDDRQSTLSGIYQYLLGKKKKKHNEQVIPENHQINNKYTKIFNKSSEDMSEVETGSVHMICTSPPYFQMKDYGTGKDQLGMETSVDIYLDHLMNVFILMQSYLLKY